MADIYDDRPEDLARFYAERMAIGYGPAFARKLDWTIRDAEAAGDRRRVRFWQRVRAIAEAQPAAHS